MSKEEYNRVKVSDNKTKTRESSLEDLFSAFLQIEDRLNGKEASINLVDGLLTTSKDIDTEMDKISAAYMLMASMEAHAELRYDNYKNYINKLSGDLDEEIRDSSTIGRMTDSKALIALKAHPKYIKAIRKLNKYSMRLKILKEAKNAFYMKSEMLRSKSANIRKYNDMSERDIRNGDQHYTRLVKEKTKKRK